MYDLLARARSLQSTPSVAGNPTSTTGEVRLVGAEPGTQKRQGRYVLGDLLGRGGMAEVFSGHAMGSHGFQKPVAIKRLLPELANDDVFVERLIGEAKLLVGMAHGNIVSVLDLARDGEDVFLVMEFIDGPSLRQLLKARGSRGLPLAITAYIVQSAAAGLEYAHGRHIIHADISPSNLLLTTSGEVRVADFGIARREGNGAGVVEGKWAYMAPEQARGEPLTPRSDVFALGVVLYELVTGQHPLGRQITADERESGPMRVVPPRVVKPGLPAGIDQICMKALAHDPRDRYASMKALADALMDERFANGWREGASELASLIRENHGGAEPVPERRTQHTDRPVTIVTRSLISQSKPVPAPPNEAAWAEPIPTRPSRPSSKALRDANSVEQTSERSAHADSLERTSERRIARPSVPQGSPLPMVSGLESGARTNSGWMEPPAQVTAAEMASVHGGSTVTGSSQIALAEKSSRWQLGVLGVAAMLGIGAAIAIQIAPDHANKASAEPLASAAPAPAPVVPSVVQVPVPVPVETPAPAPVPAPVVDEPKVTDEPKDTDCPPLAYKARTSKPIAATAPKRPEPKKPESKKLEATLRTTADRTATVTIGRDQQDIPGAKFHLAGGEYTVRVSNPDGEFRAFSCSITVPGGRVSTLEIYTEDHSCFVK